MNLCTYRYVHLNLSLAQVLPPLSHIQAGCGDLSRQEVGKEAEASDPGVFRKRQRDAVQSLVSLGKGGAIATLLPTPQQGGRSRTSRAPRAAATAGDRTPPPRWVLRVSRGWSSQEPELLPPVWQFQLVSLEERQVRAQGDLCQEWFLRQDLTRIRLVGLGVPFCRLQST